MLSRLAVTLLPATIVTAVLTPTVRSQHPIRTYADAIDQRYRRTDPKVDYTITVKPGDYSRYYVEMAIANAPKQARLRIAAWAPGGYRLLDADKNIKQLVALAESGDTLAVVHDAKLSWTINTKNAKRVTVRYATVLQGPTPNDWFLGETAGMVNGPRTYLYLEGWQLTPSHVTFRLPEGWGVATGLRPTADRNVFWAPSYDVLVDSPALLGQFASYYFRAGGVPHRIAFALGGVAPSFDTTAFVEMHRRICETTIAMFGGAPYVDFTFLYGVMGGGGLEHVNSVQIGPIPLADLQRDPRSWRGATAHEFFHTWNVKRIRPIELGPFDYTQPVRTHNLWFSEGVTNYYTEVILARSGLDSMQQFAANMARAIAAHRDNPARMVVSPEASSWTVWDPPEVTGSFRISYYLQGRLLGFLLDLAIRDSTDNVASLDDLMRYLFDHYAGERGFTTAELVGAVQAVSGYDFGDFWRRYVSGTEEIPWNDYVRNAGWEVVFREEPTVDARFDVYWVTEAGSIGWRVIAIPGTALAHAGLKTGDRLLRLNDREISWPYELYVSLGELAPGTPITLAVERMGRPVEIRLRATTYPRTIAELRDLPTLSPKMQRVRAGILGSL